MKRLYILILSGLLLVSPLTVRGAVYRWKDQQGKTHYSSAIPTTPVNDLQVKKGEHWYPYSADSAPAPQPTSPSQTVVTYRMVQSVMTIPITLNQNLERVFAVDTGASYTVISHETAAALQLHPNPDIPPLTLQTANGQVSAPLVNIASLTIGQVTTYNVAAAVHDFQDDPSISGLLGLNLLNRFTMTVDATRQQLTFEPITAQSEFLTYDCVEARAWVARGARLDDGSDEEARAYQKAIALCPDLIDAYYRLGHLYYQQHEYQRAVDLHQRLLQKAPEQAEAHYRLGVLYMLLRQFELAKGAFQTVLRLTPSHPQAQDYLKQLENSR